MALLALLHAAIAGFMLFFMAVVPQAAFKTLWVGGGDAVAGPLPPGRRAGGRCPGPGLPVIARRRRDPVGKLFGDDE